MFIYNWSHIQAQLGTVYIAEVEWKHKPLLRVACTELCCSNSTCTVALSKTCLQLYKIYVKASWSSARAEEPPAAKPLQSLPHILFPPVGSDYWVSIGEAHLFSLPSLALWWEKLRLRWIQSLLSGRDNVVHNPVITTPLLWLALIKLRSACFFRDGKLLARQRGLHLPQTLEENGEAGRQAASVWHLLASGANLQSNISLIRHGVQWKGNSFSGPCSPKQWQVRCIDMMSDV